MPIAKPRQKAAHIKARIAYVVMVVLLAVNFSIEYHRPVVNRNSGRDGSDAELETIALAGTS